MKHICVIWALSIGLLHANEKTEFTVGPHLHVILQNIHTDSISFALLDPGKNSGLCGLIMASTSFHDQLKDLTRLMDRLTISTLVPSGKIQITQDFTRFSLLGKFDPTYINVLTIRTKDGNTISENIRAVYKSMTPIVITADSCS